MGGGVVLTIPPPCLLSFHILCPEWLLFTLFLPQDTVNALLDFLGFFHFLFQSRYRYRCAVVSQQCHRIASFLRLALTKISSTKYMGIKETLY